MIKIGWDKLFTAILGVAAFACFTSVVVILILVFSNEGIWQADEPVSKFEKPVATAEKLESLEALENIQLNLIELNSQIHHYYLTGKAFHVKEYKDIQKTISLYEDRYREVATSDQKNEYVGKIQDLRRNFEQVFETIQGIFSNQKKGRQSFELAYERILSVIEEARKIAGWRVQMAMRRSSISQESSLKIEFEETMPILNAIRGIANSAGKMATYLNKYLMTLDDKDRSKYQVARKQLGIFIKDYTLYIRMDEEDKLVKKLRRYRDQMNAWGRRAVSGNDEINKQREQLAKLKTKISAVIKQARAGETIVTKKVLPKLSIKPRPKKRYVYEIALLILALFGLFFLFIRSNAQILLTDDSRGKEKSEEISNLELQLELLKLKLETAAKGGMFAAKAAPTVLIIDDDADFVRQISTRLRSLDFKVFRVYDESQAILEALRLRPDIILTDAMVSVHDNYELLKKLKSDQPNIPIIVMHGTGVDLEILRWAPISFDKVIEKSQIHVIMQAVIKELKASTSPEDEKGKTVKSRNILLIDGDATLRKILKDAMSSWRYPFISVKSGQEALSIVKEQTFDLVLMDASVPGMNTVELFNKMKILQPASTFIVMSDRPDVKTFQELEKHGAHVGIAKPFKLEDLHEIIEFFFSHDRMTFANWFKKTTDLYKHVENFKHNKKRAA